jgi:hypothetical protein
MLNLVGPKNLEYLGFPPREKLIDNGLSNSPNLPSPMFIKSLFLKISEEDS